ncbi:ATP-binding protein [Paraglaciecola aestuariivivens]
MFRTIKTQIMLVLAILVILLLSQVFLSRSIQSVFVNSLDITQQAVVKTSLVRELERDVIDLQRNVLIYKDSASEAAITRFNLLMEESQNSLKELEQLTSNEENSEVYLDYITRMHSHLKNYEESFASVIAGRTKRQSLYNSSLLVELETLFDEIIADNSAPESVQYTFEYAKYHIARAQNLLLQYLQIPDQQIIGQFQQQLLDVKTRISEQLSWNQDLQLVIDKLNKVEQDFLQLTQVTRGYLFLVNVVMAGSANEFLFLARELNRLVTEQFTNTSSDIKLTVDKARMSSDIFSLIGIIIAAATAFFLIYRIMVPINTITHVFQLLAKGKSVETIPGLTRQDEIGQLAKAADVFHEKNKQTTALLDQSQQLNAKQEALNQQLIASNKEVEQATASKSIFLANMSHEIRTPMNGIIGMLEIVLRTDLTESQRDQLNKAAYSGKILMSLINDILDFSKIEAGKLDIENIEFSVESLFSNILANVANRAQEKNLNVRFDCNPNLPAKLFGDPLRIGQILLNLCSNAVKFTRNGEVTINIDFVPQQDENNICLKIEVKDTGIGMSAKQVTQIFESFTQADGSTSRTFGGTGLGLSIVTQLVELMGGKVSVESEVNKGSTFKVELILGYPAEYTEVLSPVPAIQSELYYFSIGRMGLLNTDYIEKLDISYHHLPLSQLNNSIKNIKDTDAVILDIEDLNECKTYQSAINQLMTSAMNVAFITNTQPSSLPKQLTNRWPAKCLSHPFTPRQVSILVKDLFLAKYVKEPDHPTSLHNIKPKEFIGHLLLVEDNNINQAVAGEMLKTLGVTYDIAEDGHQAVTKIINSPQYDLILMDIQMPEMDGYEATKMLREKGYDKLTICGLSANAMKQDYLKAKEAGMDDYIVKPLKLAALENLLAKYLPEKETFHA